MKHSDVMQLLQQKYPHVNEYDVRRVVAMGFADAQRDRSTYFLGFRLSHPSQPTPTETSSVTFLASHVTEQLSNEVATLAAENSQLKERVLELEMKVQSLCQSSIQLTVIQHQLEWLISSIALLCTVLTPLSVYNPLPLILCLQSSIHTLQTFCNCLKPWDKPAEISMVMT